MKTGKNKLVAVAAVLFVIAEQGMSKEFTYLTYGGFVNNTFTYDFTSQFIAGKTRATQDGPWFREGPFSSTVTYGDQNNGNIIDSRSIRSAYPAIAWGKGDYSPWISADTELGGASGLGSTGVGYDSARVITVDDTTSFYPMAMMEHINKTVTFWGSLQVDLEWNIEIYDGTEQVFKGSFDYQVAMWESLNAAFNPSGEYAQPGYGSTSNMDYCPRSRLALPTSHELYMAKLYELDWYEEQKIWSGYSTFPIVGVNNVFYGDGEFDSEFCADAFNTKNGTFSTTFLATDDDDIKTRYQISIDGFYVYDDTAGCDSFDIGDDTQILSVDCFKHVPTFWSEEGANNRAYMKISVRDVVQSCCCSN